MRSGAHYAPVEEIGKEAYEPVPSEVDCFHAGLVSIHLFTSVQVCHSAFYSKVTHIDVKVNNKRTHGDA